MLGHCSCPELTTAILLVTEKEDGTKSLGVNSILELSTISVLGNIPSGGPRHNFEGLVRKLDIPLEQAGWTNSAKYGLQLLM